MRCLQSSARAKKLWNLYESRANAPIEALPEEHLTSLGEG
jgi:hypothetical protein